MIDEEVLAIVQECYREAKELLTKHRDKLDNMAHTLLEKEKLDEQDVRTIIEDK